MSVAPWQERPPPRREPGQPDCRPAYRQACRPACRPARRPTQHRLCFRDAVNPFERRVFVLVGGVGLGGPACRRARERMRTCRARERMRRARERVRAEARPMV